MKLGINKNIKIGVAIILPIILLIGVLLYKINIYDKDIDNILKTNAYSYLSPAVQEYIKNVYEESGEVVLTQKNKKENLAYLNPQYIDYLNMSEEEKESVDLIPNELIVDYVSGDEKYDYSTLESYYNLKDENYITPLKNQKSLGICWAEATIENAETFLMMKNGKTYSEGSTEILSPRHLDYAGSSFGIEGYINNQGFHSLGTGGNFNDAGDILSKGLSFVGSDWKYNDSYSLDTLEFSDVFDDNLSKYELDSSITIPYLNTKRLDLNKQSDNLVFTNYINEIKSLIKIYGGPYVGTQAPGYSCSAVNYYDTTNHIVDVDSECTQDGGHAMQIIGWDDNYSYKYCKNGGKHIKWTSSCSEQNTVSGKGAWILRNSWGNIYMDSYTYLAYSSAESEYQFITSLDSSQNKKWNYYFSSKLNNMTTDRKNVNNTYEYTVNFNSSFDLNTTLKKIKFINYGQNKYYKIYISSSGNDNDYQLIKSDTSDYSGFVTANFVGDNVKLNNKSKIKIVSDSNFQAKSISVFVSEDTDDMRIITKDKYYEKSNEILENGFYKIHLYSDTYNISPATEVEYSFFDEKGNDITNDIIVKNNKVFNNVLNPILYLPSSDNQSYYTVKISYNNEVLSTLRITSEMPHPSLGSGTADDPYVIMTPEDLYSINYNLESYFVLGADIDLTYDTQNENGLYYNNGNGWEAIGYSKRNAFSGSIDGKYNGVIHKIKGLKSTSMGFIFYVESSKNDISIKNIIFENAIISNSNLVAYKINGTMNNKVLIENIAAINCSFTDSNMIAYSLSSYGEKSLIVNNIFSNSTFNESQSVLSSLAWEADSNEYYTTSASIDISNIEILGKNNNKSYSFTGLVRFPKGKVNIDNVIFNNYSNAKPYIFSRLSKSESGNMPLINNMYYLNDINMYYFSPSDFNTSNFVKLNINDLRNKDKYINWKNFDNSWEIKKINDIDRIPVLKFVPFEYTSFDNISINVGNSVNIYDYISPKIDAARNISFENLTNDIISIDSNGNINALSSGAGKVHIISNYDGYEDDIVIKVDDVSKVTINFYSNNADNKVVHQTVNVNSDVNLIKNSFEKKGYIFKGWNTKSDGSGISYSDMQNVNISSSMDLYAIWSPIKYKIYFDSNDGTNTKYFQTLVYDKRVKLTRNTFINANSLYYFKEWNTKSDGSGISYSDEQEVVNLTTINNQYINLYAIWEKIELIDFINSTTDYECTYDGKNHSIDINVDVNDYNIIYSNDGINYDIDTLPKYKEVGEYKIYYKITKDGYEDLYSSNYIRIYGIKKIDNDIMVKDNNLILKNNDYDVLKNNFVIYSPYVLFAHFDSDRNIDNNLLIKTGDFITIIINNEANFEYVLSYLGDTSGDGKINYLDYVNVYNHIQKVKHPESSKKILKNEYLNAADMSGDGNITYLDYVKIYNKIKEIKGGIN